MAEFTSAEKVNIGYENEYSTDAMTGGPDKRRQLYYQLIQSMKKAESVDIIVSFLMESGVRMLLKELEHTLKRGAKIRILTGNYLGITQPSALYLIKRKLGDRVDLRFYCEKGRSFHPKSYIFHYTDYSELYIGSSNISRSALTSGIEWNYRFSSQKDPENYKEFFRTFEDLFVNHSIIIDDKELKRYSQNWHRPAVAKDLDRYDFTESETNDTKIKPLYEPRGAQIEALCALEDTRAEGAQKALIQAATGIGKTFLAAFDSKKYEKVLFVAHREEILKQAAVSFQNVRNSKDYGFFMGAEKCTDKPLIFASAAVYSNADGEFSMDRAEAIEKLKNGEIKVIFSVDMFNEGVDIPSVDMVMFLRPTESPVVFLQQLGRGLRRSKGKEYLNVLDFIGNYEKAGRVRYLLIGKNKTGKETYYPADKADYPDECFVDFDMRLIDLFAEMDKKQLTIKEQIRNEYFRIKELLGKQPTRMDLFTYMDDDVYQMAVTHSNENPFKKYLNYLEELDELTDEQKKFSQGMGKDFINLLENTNMSKVYKMPVLMAFYNHGNVRMEVSEVELLASWKKFFSTGTNWKDLEKEITYEEYRKISDKNHIQKIMKMPVRFLLKSGEEFFVKKDGAALALRDEMEEIVKEPVLAEQMKDVIEYRAMDYYRRRYKEQIKALL